MSNNVLFLWKLNGFSWLIDNNLKINNWFIWYTTASLICVYKDRTNDRKKTGLSKPPPPGSIQSTIFTASPVNHLTGIIFIVGWEVGQVNHIISKMSNIIHKLEEKLHKRHKEDDGGDHHHNHYNHFGENKRGGEEHKKGLKSKIKGKFEKVKPKKKDKKVEDF